MLSAGWVEAWNWCGSVVVEVSRHPAAPARSPTSLPDHSQVRTTRARVRALMARGASILKGFPGEVSERGGRVCVAVPAGTKIVGGVVLGTTPGGGMSFVEPPQVGWLVWGADADLLNEDTWIGHSQLAMRRPNQHANTPSPKHNPNPTRSWASTWSSSRRGPRPWRPRRRCCGT